MKKLLQINPVLRLGMSTGRIMQEIGELAMANGWESYIAYSYGHDGVQPCKSHLIPVGNKLTVMWHGLVSRLFDCHGLASIFPTRRLIRQIERLKPDIIHIHGVTCYYLNYPMLIRYLVRSGVPVVWTVHDCWLYTGHCIYYSAAGCNRWQTGCHDCPCKRSFPASWWLDRSRQNYALKKKLFTSFPTTQLTFVTVSDWMRREMSHSFVKDYRYQLIHNGIDTTIFKPEAQGDVRERYQLGTGTLIIGVAAYWIWEKGWTDVLRLATMLRPDERLVLVGVDAKQQAMLPPQVTGILRTNDIHELAALYAASTACVNFTYQDNYPTINLEAIACGTPVITYNTGGSIESVTPETGAVVEQGDVESALRIVREMASRGKDAYRDKCRQYALDHFRKEDRYADYLRLYDKLMEHECR